MSPDALWWWSMLAVALGAGGLGMEVERLLNNRRLRHRQDAREAEAQRRWTERITHGDTEWDRAIDEALREQARREHPSYVDEPSLTVMIDGKYAGHAYPKEGTWAEYVEGVDGYAGTED